MKLPPTVPIENDPKLLNPLTLAYMGDAVLEIYVRQHLIQKFAGKPHRLHRSATHYVSARAQAKVVQEIMGELSETEQWMLKRGRNAKSGTVPKNADIIEYRMSSGFECMLGYLYLTDQVERLQEIMERVFEIIEVGEEKNE